MNITEPVNMIYIGIDGGGSATRIMTERADGKRSIVNFNTTIKYTDLGIDAATGRLHEMLTHAIADEPWAECKIAISLSGASDAGKNIEFIQALQRHFPEKTLRLQIESDSTFTLHTAYRHEQSGYLIIAGTGSVAMAKDRNGTIHKVGGWGRMLGDEGGGYWLGIQALRYYLAVNDGAVPKGELFTSLEKAVSAHAGSEFSVLRSMLYSGEFNPASLAPILLDQYQDEQSKIILNNGAKALTSMIQLLRKKTGDNADAILTIHGSVIIRPEYREILASHLDRDYQIVSLRSEDVLVSLLRTARDIS